MTASAAIPTRSFHLEAGGKASRGLTVEEINHAIADRSCRLWVDLDLDQPGQRDLLRQIAGLHPLAIEDALATNSRPKLEEYADYLFIVIVGVRLHETTPDPYDLATYDLSFFLGSTFLITVHDGPSRPVADVADRLEKSPDLLSRGIDWLAHAIMDGSVDAYFPLLDRIDEFVDELEQRVIVNFDESALPEIFELKRMILLLRRHIAPERDVFNVLTNRPSALLSPDSQVYFRDIYDHILRINDSVETYRELLSSVLDSYLTQVSNRLGRVTKALSVIATLSIPFVVLSGMWGMNVRVPLAGDPSSFWAISGLQLGLGLLLLALLRYWKLL